jgi:hypothetical protein
LERHLLEELHYITHISNALSICERGLLSHRLAARIDHNDVSSEEVQDRRTGKRVPGGLLLHDYVNTYITARNPMLYKVKEGRLDELCVVRISPAVLDLPDVVMTDRNAAATLCRFQPPAHALPSVELKLIKRRYWGDGDALEQERCWNAKFTEVLVPQRIDVEHLTGIYVANETARATLVEAGCPLSVTINRHLFFLS